MRSADRKTGGLAKQFLLALSLFILDAFFLDQGFISLAVLFVAVPLILIRALLARKSKPLLKRRLAVAAIYFAAAVLAIAVIRANASIANQRAQSVIAACEKYRGIHGEYPQALADLVPEIIAKIPAAKYNFSSSSKFIYTAGKGKHTLMYVSMPPFGRRYYDFERKMWRKID